MAYNLDSGDHKGLPYEGNLTDYSRGEPLWSPARNLKSIRYSNFELVLLKAYGFSRLNGLTIQERNLFNGFGSPTV